MNTVDNTSETRSLKLRAWDSLRDAMITSFDSIDHPAGVQYNFHHGKDGLILMAQNRNGEWYPTKLLQFTGLLDKNGKEIYEGDILKFFDKIVAVVVFESFGGWCYKWVDPTYIRIRQYNPEPFFRNISLFEVVGNIYQHPNLLNS